MTGTETFYVQRMGGEDGPYDVSQLQQNDYAAHTRSSATDVDLKRLYRIEAWLKTLRGGTF